MSLANLDLYHALKSAGVNDELATKAAESVVVPGDIRDLKDEVAGLRADLKNEVASLRADFKDMQQHTQSLGVRLSRLEIRVDEGFAHLNRVVYGAVFGILLLLVRVFWPV